MANSPFIFGANGATSLVPGGVTLPGATTGTIQIQPNTSTTSYALTMPSTQGGASTTLTNDGTGNLSWAAGLPIPGTDGQVLKSMNSTIINSSYFTPYINYVGNAFAETNTNGWATYSNTAANIPSTGTGGTATGLTFSRTTSSPLRDTGTFSLVQTNSTNVQGKGVSCAFTIDSADQAKALSIQLDYNASSTFVAGNGTTAPLNDGTTTTNAGNSDIEVFIYDVTNSVLLPVSPQVFTANGSNNFTFKGIFQTSSNSTSYRLILHCATNNANATGWTFKYTNVYVGPQYLIQGSAVTDWVAYTPTFTGFGTVSVQNFIWRRVGGNLEVVGSFTSGSSTAVEARISFPTGLTSVSTLPANYVSGITGYNVQLAGARYVLQQPSVSYFNFSVQASGNNSLGAINGNAFAAAGEIITMKASVPIAGWASTTLMSNDASTRVVAASYHLSTTQAVGANAVIKYDTLDYDTHGAYSTSTGLYTCPVSGKYKISSLGILTSSGGGVYVKKSGINYSYVCGVSSSSPISGSIEIQCVAGDTLGLYSDSSLTYSNQINSINSGFINIELLTGPSQIAVVDSINARYYASSTSISGSLATIVWTTRDYDSVNGMNSGVYTISVAGKYQINTALLISGTFALNNTMIVEIQKNSSVISRFTEYAGGAETNMKAMISDQIYCLAGDTIRIQLSTSGTGPAIVSSNFDNYFSIFRTGN